MNEKIFFGINLSHNMACAVVINGEVKVAIEEERLNRIKYSWGMTQYGKLIPYKGINYCCEYLGIKPSDVDFFIVNSCFPYPNARTTLVEQMIGIDQNKIIEVSEPGHHLAHAYSTFFCSPFEESAVLVVDVNGSHTKDGIENYSIFHADHSGLQLIKNGHIKKGTIGIGEFYVLYAALLQLSPEPGGGYGNDNSLASGGKLMGYASYDLRDYSSKLSSIKQLTALIDKNDMTIDLRQLVDFLSRKGRIENIPDNVDVRMQYAWQLQNTIHWKYRTTSLRDNENIGFAGEAQAFLESSLLKLSKDARELTGSPNICVAGGTMLNVVACKRILDDTSFKKMFVQPASTDAGIAIGCAMYGYYNFSQNANRFYLKNPYVTTLGRTYSENDIKKVLSLEWPENLRYRRLSADEQITVLTDLLLSHKILAIFKGRSEFGPRALGNRSLLASPASYDMVDKLNNAKGREWYRPVAPLVLETEFDRWFDAPFDSSPFMTFAANCKDVTKKYAPAICHIDGSSRPQTVSQTTNAFLYRLLQEFKIKSGVPILVNTSFNFREPIVETPAQALKSFIEMSEHVSALLLEDYLIEFD